MVTHLSHCVGEVLAGVEPVTSAAVNHENKHAIIYGKTELDNDKRSV